MEQKQSSNDDSNEPSLNTENDLINFRQQWLLEVALEKSKQDRENEKSNKKVTSLQDESKSSSKVYETDAETLYNKGIECENNGQMNAAIQFYRLAIQKDPDVEEKLMGKPAVIPDEDFVEEIERPHDFDLVDKFVKLNLSSLSNRPDGDNFLLTDLPLEILSLICKYVISTHLDTQSLESLSETCRKFYILARDQTAWKAICQKVWGNQVRKRPYTSWRNMFINKPHLRFDGVYISKIIYFREGDPTVLSNFYSPVQCVEYYRYMRFFTNGTVILSTTPELPIRVIPLLSFKHLSSGECRVGKYKTVPNDNDQGVFISAVLQDVVIQKKMRKKKFNKRVKKYVLASTEYNIEMELCSSSRKKLNNKLTWISYASTSTIGTGSDARLIKTDFSLQEHFPPFYFSPVKSYNKFSDHPLSVC